MDFGTLLGLLKEFVSILAFKKVAHKDVDARWTWKHGKSYYGYKLSVSTDRRGKLVRRVHISPVSEGDRSHLLTVLDPSNTRRDFYADRGYTELESLRQAGWCQHVQRRAKTHRPPSEAQEKRNQRIARIRARGEHPFAGLCKLGGKVLRCIGLQRATLQLQLKAATYNLKRLGWSFKARRAFRIGTRRIRVDRKRRKHHLRWLDVPNIRLSGLIG